MEGTVNKKYVSRYHVLVIDDDERIRTLVSRFLFEHGFVVLTAENAMEAVEIMDRFVFDVLVVDVMMPQVTGTEFVRDLRAKKYDIPVLMLTALGEAEDRISGLQAGADDYLSKPFEPVELVLRLKSILKRTSKEKSDDVLYQIGEWVFDPKHDELNNGGNITHLTSMEANLLRVLAESEGQVLSRLELARVSGIESGERAIDVQVTRLRRKIEVNSKVPRYIQTVRGKGYMLRAERV